MDKLNKTRAFLTEFIIVILFFSVAAVIAINLYVEANRKNDESVLLSRASMQAQSVAENIRAQNNYYTKSGMYTEYLDENMCIVSEEEATYIQKIIVSLVDNESREVGMEYKFDILISAKGDEETIYSLSFRQYESEVVQ